MEEAMGGYNQTPECVGLKTAAPTKNGLSRKSKLAVDGLRRDAKIFDSPQKTGFSCLLIAALVDAGLC